MSGGAARRRCFRLNAITAGVACTALVSASEAAAPSALPPCLARLAEAPTKEQLLCLKQLRNGGRAPASVAAVGALRNFLILADGNTDHVSIASVLDALRSMGSGAAPAAETLSGLLSHRSMLYNERDKMLVVRLRAYIFVTLSEIGFPASALPALLDALAHVDERLTVVEIAAAARAAGSLESAGRQFAPFLLEALAVRLSAEEFSLERYEPQFPPEEATTVQLEIVRALARICSPNDQQALEVLRDLGTDRGRGLDPRLVGEARHALEVILRRPG
ncbi:MAG TPA: hypothetical protein VGW57_12635 [Chthoniobacterales bacterium]|nr:hypothetical protein [Chthoniobacterales bacterium]